MPCREWLYENEQLIQHEAELEARAAILRGSVEHTKTASDYALAASDLVSVKADIKRQKVVQSCLGFIYAGYKKHHGYWEIMEMVLAIQAYET